LGRRKVELRACMKYNLTTLFTATYKGMVEVVELVELIFLKFFYLLKHKNNSWNFSSTPSTSSTFDELSTKTTTPLGVVVFVDRIKPAVLN